MATITPVAASSNAAVTYAAASGGGDSIAGGTAQRITLIVRNGGSTITATITAVNACSQGFLHNTAVTCAAGDTEILIPAACISSSGAVGVTYSSVTSITVAAVTS